MLHVLHLKGLQRTVNAKGSKCGELEKIPLTFNFFKVKLFHCRPVNIVGVLKWLHCHPICYCFQTCLLHQYVPGNTSIAIILKKINIYIYIVAVASYYMSTYHKCEFILSVTQMN